MDDSHGDGGGRERRPSGDIVAPGGGDGRGIGTGSSSSPGPRRRPLRLPKLGTAVEGKKLRRRRRRDSSSSSSSSSESLDGDDDCADRRDDDDDDDASFSASASVSSSSTSSSALLSSLPGRLGGIKVGYPARFIQKRCRRRSRSSYSSVSSVTNADENVMVLGAERGVAPDGARLEGVALDDAGLEERLAAAAVLASDDAPDYGVVADDEPPGDDGDDASAAEERRPRPLDLAIDAVAARAKAGANAVAVSSPLFDDDGGGDQHQQPLEPPAMVFGSSRRVVRRSRSFDVAVATTRRGGFLTRHKRCRIVVEVYGGGSMGSRSFDDDDDDGGFGGGVGVGVGVGGTSSRGSPRGAADGGGGLLGDGDVEEDDAVVTVVKFLAPRATHRRSGGGSSGRGGSGGRASHGSGGGEGGDGYGGGGGQRPAAARHGGGEEDGQRRGRGWPRRRRKRRGHGGHKSRAATTFGRDDVIAEGDEDGDKNEKKKGDGDDEVVEASNEGNDDHVVGDGHDVDEDGGFAISTVGLTSGPDGDSDFFVDPHRPISPMASMDTEYCDDGGDGDAATAAASEPMNYSAPPTTTTATKATKSRGSNADDAHSVATEPAAKRKRRNRLRLKKKVKFSSSSKSRSGSPSALTSASSSLHLTVASSGCTGTERSRLGRSKRASRYVEKYVMPLRYVAVHRRSGNVCLVEACYNRDRRTREMTFRDWREAMDFEAVIRREREIESARVDRDLASVFGDELLEGGDETAEPSTEASPPLSAAAAAAAAARARMGMGRFVGGEGGAMNGMGGVLNQLGLASGEATAAAARPVGTDVVVRILVDVVSAWDLRVGDFTSSDPYCVVWMGDEEVHRTKYISKTLNPIWTVETSSFFVLTTNARDLLSCSEGLCFEVRDFDTLSSGSSLGAAMVPPRVLYESRGERMEFDLSSLPGKKHVAKGKLALQCRPATDEDVDFLRGMDKKEHHYLNFIHDHMITPRGTGGDVKRLFTKANQTVHGRKLCRVRPGPDPDRERETEWMTRHEIEAEAYNASQKWAEAGSGRLGQVFLEILGCDGLPNKDSGVAGNKTDAFVAAVFEDCFVVTDVVDDVLCPRWLPWTQRAFVFNILHPSSPIYLGVFDFDRLSAHDAIGRVTVDISNLPPDTDCVLHYNLYSSARVTRRDHFGSIIIRLRVEWKGEREAMLSLLDIPPEVHINCKTRKDFEVVKFTCEGKYNRHQFSLDTITSYLEELATLNLVWIYAKDALLNLLLWRYNVELSPLVPCLRKNGESKVLGLAMTTRRLSFSVPLQSMMMFLAGIILLERPHYIPSFCMVSFAWAMLELMSYRLRHPSPWRRCRSFKDIFFIVAFGCSLDQSRTIQAYENEAAINEFTRFWDERIASAAKESERQAEESLKRQEEYEKEMQEIGNQSVSIATQRGNGFTVDPVKPFLFPIQLYLGTAVMHLRVGRNILIWEEVFYSFWVTVASLVLAVSFLFVPWGFAIIWSARIIVWTCLGPWMKVFDVLYYSRLKELTEEEKREQEEKKLKARRLMTRKAAKDARAKRENAEKLKAMKKYRFGEYIMEVPIIRLDRHRDFPLIQSSAIPHQDEELTSAEVSQPKASRIFVPGQQLDEDLIPKPIQDLRASMGPRMESSLTHHHC